MTDGQLVKSKIQQILMDNELTVTLTPNGFNVPYDSTAVIINVVEQETRTLVMMYVPVLREVDEMLYQNRQAYVFSSARFMQRYPDFRVTPYPEGLSAMVEAARETKRA